MGRATQGVRLINLRENDIIASVACVLVNEEEENELKDPDDSNMDNEGNAGEENGKEFDD
jgi:DNA gyrase subunit A